jgi:2-polyprenyl-3-methyl-5-hydroxy-6-metoxy-1,4-benzoquinol methylase
MRALLALAECEALAPSSVLEIAAGDASLVATLEARSGCTVWANDLREDHLKEALKSYVNGARIHLASGNVFELDPNLGSFDLVVACEIIEHVAHGIDFVRKLASLTAPAGRILLTTPNGAHLSNRLPAYFEIPDHSILEKDQFKPDADGHLFLIRPEEMLRIADEAGLQLETLYLWGSPFISGHLGLRFFSRLLPMSTCLLLEDLTNVSPFREKLCCAMTAILRPRDDKRALTP